MEKTKSKTFYANQIKEVIIELSKSSNARDRLFAVVIVLSYHGLLWKSEVMDIAVRDVKKLYEGRYEIYFRSVRKTDKTELAEFKFLLPMYCTDIMDCYIEELYPELLGISRFLKNMSGKGAKAKRKQNMGINALTEVPRRACEILGIDADGYTTNCWRRSATMNMADCGISLINLKRAGGWSSDKVAQEYVDNSKKVRMDNMELLQPVESECNTEERKCKEYDDVVEKSTNVVEKSTKVGT